MKPILRLGVAVAIFASAIAMSGGAQAYRPGCTAPPCGGQSPGETAANNLSFPVIMSDDVYPTGFPADNLWKWAEITNPLTQCIGEQGVLPNEPVPTEYVCYYGRHVTVSSEEGSVGQLVFDGDSKVWWLQKRTQNFWKAYSPLYTAADDTAYGPLVVSAVDVGDLLESSPDIGGRKIRVEFNLLQDVTGNPVFESQLVANFDDPTECTIPVEAGQSIGCFAALAMSGAVPGTEQSGNEIQGADFGPGGTVTYPGTQRLVDPTTLRTATLADGSTVPVDALDYSDCARLVIQQISPSTEPTWDPNTGQWTGTGVGAPVVNAAAYTGAWPVEITSGGSIVYGYNWNAKTVPLGLYRITMVLDGNDDQGPRCGHLQTEFAAGITKIANQGEANPSTLVYAGDSQLGDEGGLAYIDVQLVNKGGGGGKKNQ